MHDDAGRPTLRLTAPHPSAPGWLVVAAVLASALAMLPATAFAQHTLTGRITASGEPLSGARVELRRAADTLHTPPARGASDERGRYELRGLPADRYLLVVTRLGYAPARHMITLGAEAERRQDVALEPAPL